MCHCSDDIHPVDALGELAARLSFLTDAFSQPESSRFQFSDDGQFGLNLFLHDIHAEVKRIEDQLYNKKEVSS